MSKIMVLEKAFDNWDKRREKPELPMKKEDKIEVVELLKEFMEIIRQEIITLKIRKV